MARFSSVLTFIYLLLSIFFLMKSSTECYTSKEESKTYDDFLSENSLYESDTDDIYDEESPSKSYEEEKINPNDKIISDKEIDDSEGYDWYNQELPSRSYGEEETEGKRGFRQIGNLKLKFLDLLIFK